MEFYKNRDLQSIKYIGINGEQCTEEWSIISGYSKYMVSTLGRVLSLERIVNGKRYKPLILKQGLNDGGYLIANLYSDRYVCRIFRVHRLVGSTFLENPLGKKTINHINTNRTHNYLWNLEWATHSENNIHAYANGKRKALLGKTGSLCKNSKPVYQYDMNGNFLKKFYGITEAFRETGIGFKLISKVCKGERRQTHGFIWSYQKLTA